VSPELLIAANPARESRLPYLLCVPLGDGLVFGTAGAWPGTSALYCPSQSLDVWLAEPEIIERAGPVRRSWLTGSPICRSGRDRADRVLRQPAACRGVDVPPPRDCDPRTGTHGRQYIRGRDSAKRRADRLARRAEAANV
jgi:hypothetical protein